MSLCFIFPTVGDGTCLFRSLSFVMYGTDLMSTDVRELIVLHVVDNWERFSIMTYGRNGDNYTLALMNISPKLNDKSYHKHQIWIKYL